MAATRSLVAVCTTDGWLRCGHDGTALDLAQGVVTLSWATPAEAAWSDPPELPGPAPAGLAFDPGGCLYHGDPDTGQVQWIPWQPADALARRGAASDPVDLLAPPPSPGFGQFQPVDPTPEPALEPAALALDWEQHLFVLDGRDGSVWVFDLDGRRAIRHLVLDAPVVDLASDPANQGATVLLVVDDPATPLWRVAARRSPVAIDVPATATADLDPTARPARVASDPAGHLWMLWRTPAGEGLAVAVADDRLASTSSPGPVEPLGPFPGATDLELDGDGEVVVAGPPGDDLRVFSPAEGVAGEEPPLRARGYDGRGIVRTPDGRIGYWTSAGLRLAVAARLVYAAEGQVDLFELDGQAYQQRWGRLFVDACIPDGTAVEVSFVTADDEPGLAAPDGSSVVRTLPANLDPGDPRVPLAEPPLVATGLVTRFSPWRPLHRREVGGDVAWTGPGATPTAGPANVAGGPAFETYEGLVDAPPGRWLWVRLRLRGATASTPRVRAVRVEYPGTDWLGRLPRFWSQDPDAADFLFRYLSLADGQLNDLDARAEQRDLVLDPFGAPVGMLPWVASLVGLSLDERWPEAARRQLLSEVICLFRRRGTLGALTRMLEIYLGVAPVIVESWRLRGVGGALVGQSDPGLANSVVGFGLRVGGAVGDEDPTALGGGDVDDAFTSHAHRFTVVIPRLLDDDQVQCVRDLLDAHRPAHTLYDLCTVGAGMRVGLGLHVALTSVVGPRAGWRELQVGATALGTDAVVGQPGQGLRPGGSRLGLDSRTDT